MGKCLEVKDLTTCFFTPDGIVKAVDGVSFDINEGEILGLVGESGCGKSCTAFSLMGLIPPPGRIVKGEVLFDGRDLLKMGMSELRHIRGNQIALVFQEPQTSLNPVLTIETQLTESIELHLKMDKKAAVKRAIELLTLVGIADAASKIKAYPYQFSGGMLQRVMIAMAVSCNPKLIIADEPTTALDVTIQAQLLEILQDMTKRFGMALIIITHNLGVVARYALRVNVMYAGRIVEKGVSSDIYGNPGHPYTIGLMLSVPRLDETIKKRLKPIDGMPPRLINMPPTCPFLPRCSYAVSACRQEPTPNLRQIGEYHWTRCRLDISREASSVNITEQVPGLIPQEKTKTENNILLDVRNMKMYFQVTRGLIRQHKVGDIKAVDGISFFVKKGETLGLVGESGCGKTTTGRCIVGIYHSTSGEVLFEGNDLVNLKGNAMHQVRQRIQMVFQDPYGSLNPRMCSRDIIGEPLKAHNIVHSRREYNEKIERMLVAVGLSPDMANRFPHEFSGGQRQRISIARSLILNPNLIICDEPVSALDVSIQAQIINLLEDLQAKLNLSYLIIAHDLAVVRHISNRIAVMYLGRIVEIASRTELYLKPLHPYTISLLSAVPVPDPIVESTRKRIMLPGEVPSVMNPPPGCHFHPRCAEAMDICKKEAPTLAKRLDSSGDEHWVACHRR